MTTTTHEKFAAIWRPLLHDGQPPDGAIADAWARTEQLLIERYGARVPAAQRREMVGEMAIAWLLRALSPAATPEDTELASLAQQAALWLGALRYDLDRLYEGYYHLLQGWGVYR